MGKPNKALKQKVLALPRILTTEPKHQVKVEKMKALIIADIRDETQMPPTAARLAQEWADLRAAMDDLDDQKSAIQVQIDAYAQLLINQYEAEGIDKLHLESGDAPRLQYEPYAQVEDGAKFFEWCVKNGYKNSLQLPWQTRNKIVKDLLMEGEEPDGVKIYNHPKIVKR